MEVRDSRQDASTTAKPVDINDPYIQNLGKWAVAQHVKQANDGIKFNKVNHAEVKPQATNIYIVHTSHVAKPPHFADLEQWYRSMVAPNTSSGRILYTYDTVMHGFAVQLIGDEAQRMSSSAGVTGVYEGRVTHTHTTRSPGFLGLDPGFGAWKDADFGDGVIIGFVDTGIWPESSSFDDSGLGPVRPSWRGGCVNAEDFNASLCNNKLVGARAFNSARQATASSKSSGGVASPRDTDGHGTHVASTAARSEVRGAGVAMFARGTARGVAPKARIAMYKVPDGSPPVADIVAAVDAAVKDGVDIISISLGYDPCPFHNDALAIDGA
ncbi:hypothetical protein PR202_ga29444 [Eleusine coracana subsp. coracana]|uniref:Uncharacterized protein n=1 Tax=Eleusine coracana subsp. coracana TaxID=191504 RepID=A0AAV5DLE8_ELECO|nr:hypothetical protein PR202_ga29444 [Eleusine coracana subsp. coracana]